MLSTSSIPAGFGQERVSSAAPHNRLLPRKATAWGPLAGGKHEEAEEHPFRSPWSEPEHPEMERGQLPPFGGFQEG